MEAGEEIIVLANMNEDVLVKDIAQFCQATNLVEAIHSLHGPSPVPTHQWGSKAINRIFVTKTVLTKEQGGFLSFGKVTISNHWVVWVNIPAVNLGMDQDQAIK